MTTREKVIEGLVYLFGAALLIISLVSIVAIMSMTQPAYVPIEKPAPDTEELQCAHVLRSSLMRSNLEPPSIEKLIDVCRGVINNAD